MVERNDDVRDGIASAARALCAEVETVRFPFSGGGGTGLAAIARQVLAAVEAGVHLTAEGDAALRFAGELLERMLIANAEAAAGATPTTAQGGYQHQPALDEGALVPEVLPPEEDPNDWVELSLFGYNLRQQKGKLISGKVHAGDFAAVARVEMALGPLVCRRCVETFPYERAQADGRLCSKCRRLVVVAPNGRPASVQG